VEKKEEIRSYWNRKQPSKWYSALPEGTQEYYLDVEKKRYEVFCPYIPHIAEFDRWKGKKVLEVGVGMGIDHWQYVKNGAITYGVDLTDGAIEETKKLLSAFGLHSELKRMDAEHLEFPDDYFDMVYSMGVLHHTPATQQAIDEIQRVLKPGGKAIIMLYSKDWHHYVIRVLWKGVMKGHLRLVNWDLQELTNVHSEAYGHCPLTKLYHRKEIRKIFSKFSKADIRHYHYKSKSMNPIINSLQSVKSRKYLQGNWVIKAIK
jgi:ubiquinone/menaquinone biosynthesis C-methylase UbiE